MDEKFQPFRRILKPGQYGLVLKKGVRIEKGLCSLVVLSAEKDSSRLGLIVSKKVGKAVVRNRIKRVAREIFRRNRDGWPKVEIVFIARQKIKHCSFGEIEKAFLDSISKFSGSKPGKGRC